MHFSVLHPAHFRTQTTLRFVKFKTIIVDGFVPDKFREGEKITKHQCCDCVSLDCVSALYTVIPAYSAELQMEMPK